MKKFLINFKNIIQFSVTLVTSREFAFIYCLVGTISQTAHTYYLLDGISSLTGWWKILQTSLLAFFISSSLLYFTSISDSNDKSPSGRRVLKAVVLFMWLEIVINLYYYSKHIIIDTNNYDTQNLFQLAFGILIACIIPVTIKLYSSQIRAKEWLSDDKEDKTDINNVDLKEQIMSEVQDLLVNYQPSSSEDEDGKDEKIDNLISKMQETLEKFPEYGSNPKEYLETIINKKVIDIDENIKKSFAENSELFLKQFERKLEMLTKK